MVNKKYLDELIKETGNEFAQIFEDVVEPNIWYSTNSYTLNALINADINKGLRAGKRICYAGKSGTGKTFFMLELMKSFLNDNKKNVVALFESEDATTKEMMLSRYLDESRIIKYPVSTVEDYRHQKYKLLKTYEKHFNEKGDDRPYNLMICLDSLGYLGTNEETKNVETNANKADMGKRAQLIKGTFRTVNLLMARLQVPYICINHTYDDPSSFIKMEKMSGGSGLEFVADTIMFLTKAQDKDTTSKEVHGSIITASTFKNRFCRDKQKLKTRLKHNGGLDKYYGMLELGVESGVIEKSGNLYKFPDGTSKTESPIMKNPEQYFTEEILNKINEYVYKKLSFGGSNE